MLEGSEFEIITDSQIMKSFFRKPKLSRREIRWLGIFPINFKPGNLPVLRDTLSRAPHVAMNLLEIVKDDLEYIAGVYCIPKSAIPQVLSLAHDAKLQAILGFLQRYHD